MGKYKLRQFEEFTQFENTFEFARENKGKWKEVFGNSNPIILELACGYGHYASELGSKNPNFNYIGVDRKANRMWHGAKWCIVNNIKNVRFLRISIDLIEDFFAPNEVSELWITFPDPQPKDRSAKNRLTHPLFLERYQNVLKSGGTIHLKTDSSSFYSFTKFVIDDCDLPLEVDHDDIYNWEARPDFLNIKTYYEQKWLKEGKLIKYLKFQLRENAFKHITDYRKYGINESS